MAWNDKGGGPWGAPPTGNSNEPRNRPPPSGGGRGGPNDFDAMLRRGQERLNDMLSGGTGGGRFIAIAVAFILLVWIASGIYTVDPNEEAVIQRFGALARTESAGLHYHLPAPIETATLVDVTQRHQTEIGLQNNRDGASTMLTGDSNILELDFVVAWQVRDPVKYLFSVEDPEQALHRAAESAMREVIGQSNVQHAMNEGRGEIEASSASILQSMLDRYGSGIQLAESATNPGVQLQHADPPAPVQDAFSDVQRARAELEQQRNDGEKYRNDILPRARGQAQQIIQDAGGYKDRTIAEAKGQAQQFISLLDAYKQAPAVTQRRMYIDAMESILQHGHKTVIDPSVESKGGIVPYLPLTGLPAAPAPSKPVQ